MVQHFTTKRTPGLDDFTSKFYQIFKEENDSNRTYFSPKPKKKNESFPNSLYKPIVALLSEPGKDSTRAENYRPVLLTTNGCKHAIITPHLEMEGGENTT